MVADRAVLAALVSRLVTTTAYDPATVQAFAVALWTDSDAKWNMIDNHHRGTECSEFLEMKIELIAESVHLCGLRVSVVRPPQGSTAC